MYLDAQTIITFASLLTAMGVIAHYLNKGHQWYMKQEKQDVDITAIQNEIIEQKKEQRLHTYALLACLKGLKEQGCNGPVTEAINDIEKHVTKKAHE